jgi:predicted component of type VI protein secretion system
MPKLKAVFRYFGREVIKKGINLFILHPDFNSFRPFSGKFMIGRGQDCDIKVSDISVSRYHCEIRYKDGKFWLQDTLSKFGTLVLAKGSIDLEPEMTKAVQIGRSVISFTVKPYS